MGRRGDATLWGLIALAVVGWALSCWLAVLEVDLGITIVAGLAAGTATMSAVLRRYMRRYERSFVLGYHAGVHDSKPDAEIYPLGECPVLTEGVRRYHDGI